MKIGSPGHWWVRLHSLHLIVQIMEHPESTIENYKLCVYIPGHAKAYDHEQFMLDNPNPENWRYIPDPFAV